MLLRIFPALFLIATPVLAAEMDHAAMHDMAAPTLSVQAEKDSLKKGEEYKGTFTLRNTGGKIVSPDDFQEVHTKKIHALVIDQSLGDYHHLHPEYTKDGVYIYGFTPATARDYKVWLDVTPVGGAQQLVSFTLHGTESCKDGCAEKTPNDRGEFVSNKVTVTFDKPLKAGVESKGTVTIKDAKGVPVSNLEPVMGAYAHIAGFYDDFDTVQHLHPTGDAPETAGARGTSPLTFMLTPAKKGFLRYIIQLRVDGQDVFLPMGANVE